MMGKGGLGALMKQAQQMQENMARMQEELKSIEELIRALRCLPGVGPKSAQRMAYHLLQRDHEGAKRLADGLNLALDRIRHCGKCNTFTEAEVCERCVSARRDPSLLCVVETP